MQENIRNITKGYMRMDYVDEISYWCFIGMVPLLLIFKGALLYGLANKRLRHIAQVSSIMCFVVWFSKKLNSKTYCFIYYLFLDVVFQFSAKGTTQLIHISSFLVYCACDTFTSNPGLHYYLFGQLVT